MNDREQLSQCRTPAPALTKGLVDRPPPPPRNNREKGEFAETNKNRVLVEGVPFIT